MVSASGQDGVWATLKSLDKGQRNAVIASFLGWTLDAFDFFIMTLVLADIAKDFHTTVKDVAYGITLTLAMRPIGAFVFGILADRFGRRPVLMADILLFSVFEGASAFAPNLTVFLILRALFGIAMGGDGGLDPRSPWNRFRPRCAVSCPASCKKATPSAIFFRQRRSACFMA